MFIKPVERFLAFRYLRARRAEGFISVIAWFSFLGITLGVATLIIVMSVMNGFRAELIDRILGLNGHIGVFKTDGQPLKNYNEVSFKLSEIPTIVAATPQIGSGHGYLIAQRTGRSCSGSGLVRSGCP